MKAQKSTARFLSFTKPILSFLTLIIGLSLLAGGLPLSASPPVKPEDHPKQWAKTLQAPGLDRFAQVDDGLYRGRQPEPEGYNSLKSIGMRSVVDLRESDPHDEKESVEKLGMQFLHIPQSATGVEEENLVRFLRYATDPKNRPIFVHCRQGVDRTGTNVAVYRIVVNGWSKEEALKEMYGFGYNHGLWKNLEKYIRAFDPAAVAKKAGLAYPPKK
jgi:protein tyrosine/serine phosphatase